jgi:hypothetical protein
MSDYENNNTITDNNNNSNKMLYISFNQNSSSFAIGTENDFINSFNFSFQR